MFKTQEQSLKTLIKMGITENTSYFRGAKVGLFKFKKQLISKVLSKVYAKELLSPLGFKELRNE